MNKNFLSFIHLADIHFDKNSGDPHDLDEDIRNELLRDIDQNVISKIGTPDAIFVCGDISFSANSTEYDTAKVFLFELCDKLKINKTQVFCVPGNHDVDRNIPMSSEGFLTIQEKIETATNIDEQIVKYHRDTIFNNSLFEHIHSYNSFASLFRCNISVDKPVWTEDFTLNDNTYLRIIGLNSVIISNHNDTLERRMIIGANQIPKNEDNVTYLSLCHHPHECLVDRHQIINKINQRIKIQLYGHKHVHSLNIVNDNLIIGAGATHPSRSEKEWIPRYNWLTISTICDEGKSNLVVKVFPRLFSKDSQSFEPDYNSCGGNEFKQFFLKHQCKNGIKIESSNKQKSRIKEEDDDTTVEKDIMADLKSISDREIAYDFFSLSYVLRHKLLSDFGLITESDEGIEHQSIIERILEDLRDRDDIKSFHDSIIKIME